MPHDHGHVLEDEAVFDPPQAGDFVADLTGTSHVVVPDCPQVFGALHSQILLLRGTQLSTQRTRPRAGVRFMTLPPAYRRVTGSRWRSHAPAWRAVGSFPG